MNFLLVEDKFTEKNATKSWSSNRKDLTWKPSRKPIEDLSWFMLRYANSKIFELLYLFHMYINKIFSAQFIKLPNKPTLRKH